jgi:hypothetical protein
MIKTPKILLIVEKPMGMSFLAARLKKWACEIHFASSCKTAEELVSTRRFDLVLSEFRLWNESSNPLATLLVGSDTTLVYSYPVETGCWWLPAVMNGKSCWGSLAMQPSEFIGFLDNFLRSIGAREATSLEEFGDISFYAIAD